MANKSKLILSESRVCVALDDIREKSLRILMKAGCKLKNMQIKLLII
jgi:hypothetical protein